MTNHFTLGRSSDLGLTIGACVGQQVICGKCVPYESFQDRSFPHREFLALPKGIKNKGIRVPFVFL